MPSRTRLQVIARAARRRARKFLAAAPRERAEAEYRELAMAMPVGVVQRDRNGRLSFVNRELLRIAGLAPDTAVGDITASLFHPDDRVLALAAMEHTRRTGRPYEHELRVVRPDGEVRFVVVRGSVQLDADGKGADYLATMTDVTDRHRAEAALNRSERLHRLTINSLPGVLVGLYDRDLRCVLMEGEATSDQLNTTVCAGRTLAEFANRETAELLEPGMRAAIVDGREETYAYASPRDGSYRENHIGPLRTAEGEIEGVVIVSRDITAQRRAEEARRAADEQFRIAFDQAPIGIVNLDLDGRFRRVNQALCDMTGYTADELLRMGPYEIVHVDDVAVVGALLGESEVQDSAAHEHRITHADGHVVWVDTRVALVRDEHGKPAHVLAQVQDINDRRGHEQRLEHMADHDPMTGLLNRRGLERELSGQLARARRYPGGGTLAVIDLDGFKHVNDTLGHAAGDALLVGVADALRQRLRETDVIARMGGDEFAVILPTESLEQAATVARNMLETVRERATKLFGTGASVTASIGLAAFEGQLAADQMLVRADRAMYDAKESGKDGYAVYNDVALQDDVVDEPAVDADRTAGRR